MGTYLLNAGKYQVLTYDSIVMFSLLRYINIEFPLNLHEFFKVTDSFKLSFEVIKTSFAHSQSAHLGTSEVQVLGRRSYLFNQLPNPKFAAYHKTASFLQNGFGVAVTILSSCIGVIFIKLFTHCFAWGLVALKAGLHSTSESLTSKKEYKPQTNVEAAKRILGELLKIWLLLVTVTSDGILIKSIISNMILLLLAIAL